MEFQVSKDTQYEQEMSEEVKKMRHDIIKLEREIKSLRKEIERSKSSTEINKINWELRKRNIILFNLEEKENEVKEDLIDEIVEFFMKYYELDLKQDHLLDDLYRTGNQKGNRPVVIRLYSYMLKNWIINNSSVLKHTKYFVSSDYCKEDRRIRREWIPILRKEKLKGNYAKLIHTRMVINRKLYTLEEYRISTEERELSATAAISTREEVQSPSQQQQEESMSSPKGYQGQIHDASGLHAISRDSARATRSKQKSIADMSTNSMTDELFGIFKEPNSVGVNSSEISKSLGVKKKIKSKVKGQNHNYSLRSWLKDKEINK